MPKHRTIYKRKHADPPDLWARYQRTRSVADRNRLVEFYVEQELVRAIALKLNMSGIGKEYNFNADDLESFGWHGLIRAVEGFDPGRGCVFRTYAGRKIVGAMLDGVREEGDHRPRLIRDRRAKLNAMVEAFAAEHGRKPTDAEIRALVAKSGMTEAKVDRVLHDGLVDIQQVPIDIHIRDENTDLPMRLLCHHTTRQLKRLEDRDEIDWCLRGAATLATTDSPGDPRNRRIFEHLTLGGHVQRDIANMFGISASRVSQIHSRTLNLMRAFAFAARKAQAA